MKWNERYRCPYCGASLDPGEVCDCQREQHDAGADRPEKEEALEKEKWRRVSTPSTTKPKIYTTSAYHR